MATEKFDVKLKQDLKEKIIAICNVKNCRPEDIIETEALIGGQGKLKLDSLDAVEIVMMLEKDYQIKLDNPGASRKILKTFLTMYDYVFTQANK